MPLTADPLGKVFAELNATTPMNLELLRAAERAHTADNPGEHTFNTYRSSLEWVLPDRSGLAASVEFYINDDTPSKPYIGAIYKMVVKDEEGHVTHALHEHLDEIPGLVESVLGPIRECDIGHSSMEGGVIDLVYTGIEL